MRLRGSALVRAVLIAAVTYVGMLLVWRLFEPIYMRALAVFVEIADAAGVLPTPVQAVVVPRRGLAIVGAGVKAIAIPQRIIGADLALVVALVVVTSWLSWRQRARRLPVGLLGIFAVHLATLVGQTSIGVTASALDRGDDREEALDRREGIQCLNHAVEVQCDVLVHDDVAEARKQFERRDDIRRESSVAQKGANGIRVVLEPVPAPRRKLSRDIDDELADAEQRKQDIVVE